MNENLREQLLAMRREDERVRAELAQTGELFDGYHPLMETVHLENAARLERMITENGWLGKTLVGADGAEAAWLVLQHAISRPDLQRRGLEILRREVERGEIPARQAAHLEDRILYFEGKPQIYGTQFDWNEPGEMAPHEIFEPENIDERRAAVGLSVPYAEVIEEQIEAIKKFNEKAPTNYAERQADFEAWARKVGWRQ